MTYPFYIPSIYRPNSEFLIKIRDFQLKYYIIIASHQYDSYNKNFPKENLVILPDNIIKISEIRQYIVELGINNNESRIWMSDDDLSKFFIKEEKEDKDVKTEGKKLDELDFKTFIERSEDIIKKISILDTSIIQFGFKYSTFAIPKNKISINTNIGMIQLLDVSRIKEKVSYDYNFPALEDTDFTIQLFNNGFNNCCLNHFIITAPKSGGKSKKNKGGLEIEYQNGAKQKGILAFQNKYPKLIKITDLEKGKYKILWKTFDKKVLPLLLTKAV